MGFFQNTRKPEGFGGKIMVAMMNSGGHSALAEWGFSQMGDHTVSKALDAGCGGGANVKRLLARCGDVTGLDYSEVSVEKSRKVNAAAIQNGNCRIVQGDTASMPFENDSFDLVTAFETVYFWELEKAFAEVYRVLKKDGVFLICNKSDGENEADKKWEDRIRGMKIYKAEELKKVLEQIGFTDIQIARETKKHWFGIIMAK